MVVVAVIRLESVASEILISLNCPLSSNLNGVEGEVVLNELDAKPNLETSLSRLRSKTELYLETLHVNDWGLFG